jgi:hypothetical protein
MSIVSQIEVADAEIKSLEIPEWLVNGQPLKVNFYPLTVSEYRKINKRYPNFMENLLEAEIQVHIIIIKALDDNGEKLFDFGDKAWFDNRDPMVVMRLASRLVTSKSVEELEKN